MVAMEAMRELMRNRVTRKPLNRPMRPHTTMAAMIPATPPNWDPTREDTMVDRATDMPRDRSISPLISRKVMPMATIPYMLRSEASLIRLLGPEKYGTPKKP